MAVNFVQDFSWGPLTNDGDLQTNYFRIPFSGTPHLKGTAYLAEVSLGATGGKGGTAVVTSLAPIEPTRRSP